MCIYSFSAIIVYLRAEEKRLTPWCAFVHSAFQLVSKVRLRHPNHAYSAALPSLWNKVLIKG